MSAGTNTTTIDLGATPVAEKQLFVADCGHDMRDEMDEGLRLRELGGARPDEGITAMTERIVAENAQLRAELERLASAAESKKHAHTDWVDDDVRARHPKA